MKILTSIVALAIMLSCGKSGNNDEIKYYDVEKPADSQSQQAYLINDHNNQQMAKLTYSPEQDLWEISSKGEYWYGSFKNEKRKFYTNSGDVFAEIKFKDDGFKLRNPEGQLIWKIKINANKIKISDNEEMNNAYEIKKKSDLLASLIQNEKDIGTIELGTEQNPALIKNQQHTYFLAGPGQHISAAILLIDEIKPAHQYMILSQLISSQI